MGAFFTLEMGEEHISYKFCILTMGVQNMLNKLLRDNRTAVALTIIVLLVTTIPLYALAHFNYPTTDDFAFASAIYDGILLGKSWWEIIKDSWATVARFYLTWQGRYFDVSLYAFAVGAAVPELYGLGTYLVLTVFIIGTISFLRTVTYKVMKWESDVSWIVSIWFAIIQLWFVPHAVEAFYWYSGASAYTLSYALTLLIFTFLIFYYDETEKWKKITYAIGTIACSIMVGGSNYAIVLLAAEIYFVAIVVSTIRKHKAIFLKVAFLVLMFGFACSAFAPGNKTRLNSVESLGVVGSITASIKKAALFCVEWFHIPVLIFIVLIVLLSYKQIKSMDYQFKMPLLVTIISFGLFASMLTPPFYAGATWGPGRLINMVYYCYYLFLIGNILYWIGWIIHKGNPENVAAQRKIYPTIVILAACILFLVCFKWYGLQSNNSTSAMLSLAKGEAKQYKLENRERWLLYEDETLKDIEVVDFSVKPRLLYYDDIQKDSTDWRNYTVAQFFGKNSVKIKE